MSEREDVPNDLLPPSNYGQRQCGKGRFTVYYDGIGGELPAEIYPDFVLAVLEGAKRFDGNDNALVVIDPLVRHSIFDVIGVTEDTIYHSERVSDEEFRTMIDALQHTAEQYLGQGPARQEYSSPRISFDDYHIFQHELLVASLANGEMQLQYIPFVALAGNIPSDDPTKNQEAIQWLGTVVDQQRIGKFTFNPESRTAQRHALLIWTAK